MLGILRFQPWGASASNAILVTPVAALTATTLGTQFNPSGHLTNWAAVHIATRHAEKGGPRVSSL